MIIQVKNSNVLKSLLLHAFDPVLVDIVAYIADKYGLVITEGYRDKLHPNDLHGTDPVRAIDIRAWTYPRKLLETIQRDVNSKWIYDPARPEMVCFLVHTNRFTDGVHVHIQVHPNTIKKEEV